MFVAIDIVASFLSLATALFLVLTDGLTPLPTAPAELIGALTRRIAPVVIALTAASVAFKLFRHWMAEARTTTGHLVRLTVGARLQGPAIRGSGWEYPSPGRTPESGAIGSADRPVKSHESVQAVSELSEAVAKAIKAWLEIGGGRGG